MGIDRVGNACTPALSRKESPVLYRGKKLATQLVERMRALHSYFHNMIGLLTEINGNPTPEEIPFVPSFHLPRNDYILPIEPQKVWHFPSQLSTF